MARVPYHTEYDICDHIIQKSCSGIGSIESYWSSLHHVHSYPSTDIRRLDGREHQTCGARFRLDSVGLHNTDLHLWSHNTQSPGWRFFNSETRISSIVGSISRRELPPDLLLTSGIRSRLRGSERYRAFPLWDGCIGWLYAFRLRRLLFTSSQAL